MKSISAADFSKTAPTPGGKTHTDFDGGGSLLARGQFDGEGAAQRVHLVRARLPGHRGVGGCRRRRPGDAVGRDPAAVLAVDEQLADLLGHCDVVHHHCELGRVHRAFVC